MNVKVKTFVEILFPDENPLGFTRAIRDIFGVIDVTQRFMMTICEGSKFTVE